MTTTITAIIGDRGTAYTRWRVSDDTTKRHATVTIRDWPAKGYPSYHIVLSDGREIGGELPSHFVDRLAVRWVREGV